MKKIKVLVIPILVLIFGGIIYFGVFNKTDKPTVQISDKDQVTKEEEQEDLPMTEEEIATEIEKCEKEKAFFQAECFSDLALKAKDPLLCKRVSDIEDIGFEESRSFINEGACIADVAKYFDYDISLCDQVKEVPDWYSVCVGLIVTDHVTMNKDASLCEFETVKNDPGWYGNCLSSSVKSEEDVNICDKVSGSGNPICFDHAYLILALDYKDVGYCDKATRMDSSKPLCISVYAKKNNDLNLCVNLDSDENKCICYNIFFKEINQNICDGLSDELQKSTCNRCLEMDLYKNL